MGYIGIRTTGSIYGYRVERRAYSERVRNKQEREEVAAGLDEYLNPPSGLPNFAVRNFDEPRDRRRRQARSVSHLHLRLIARGLRVRCGHQECRVAAQEYRQEQEAAEKRRAQRWSSGEIARLLGLPANASQPIAYRPARRPRLR